MRRAAAGLALGALLGAGAEARAASLFDYGVNGIWGPGEAVRMQDNANIYTTSYNPTPPYNGSFSAIMEQGFHDFTKSFGAPLTESQTIDAGTHLVGSGGSSTFIDGDGVVRTLTGGAKDGFASKVTNHLAYGDPVLDDAWTVTFDGYGSTGVPGAPLFIDGGQVQSIQYSSGATLQFQLNDYAVTAGTALGTFAFDIDTFLVGAGFTGTTLTLSITDQGVTQTWVNTGFPTSVTIYDSHTYVLQVSFQTNLGPVTDPEFLVRLGGTFHLGAPPDQPVPEPATLGLAAAGAIALARRLRRA